jgi:hypothetical protein
MDVLVLWLLWNRVPRPEQLNPATTHASGISGFPVRGIAGHNVFCPDLPGEETNQIGV